ncbi:MAG: BrnT family toxin [Gammaproteobacteria bacterium]
MDFEWDRNKAASNLKKHGISFQEAATVFGDSSALTFNDPDHSVGEHRLLTFGVTRTGRFVVVAHTELDSSMRIFSARLMTKQERKIYEEG